MDADIRTQRALYRAISHLLRPLIRLLLRHSVSFSAFAELAKRAYVDVAISDFGIRGKKPSMSRVSILSGLTRKDVQRLLAAPAEAAVAEGEHYNRAARVLTAWARDPDFCDKRGEPLALPVDGATSSFAALVKRHSGDMPARAVLDELLRVGAVRRRGDDSLELVARAFVPQRSAVDKLGILGADVADLIQTIDHNIEHGAAEPRFQRKVMYHSMPADVLPEFRELSAAQAQLLLEQLDKWLAAHDIDDPGDGPAAARRRVGMGVFYFEDAAKPIKPEGE